MTREEAKATIQKLVTRFSEHRKDYHLADYNEQKTRQDFINPFFKALGWDIDNEKGDSEAYREVIYEDKVVVKGKAKAPDYGFRLSGSGKKRLFYVEAKKPSVPLKTNKESAYQLRRYGSSAQAHVSILTNFEDFIIYDCSKVPNLNDATTVARLKHIGFEDYIKEFDFIYDIFSHEAVTKGRFDQFVQTSASKKGTDTLDKRFVQSLDQWRKYLATSIAVNNKKINDEELNFAVQQTIDRLIFLRFCEDRSVEPYGQLQKAVSKGDAYKNLFDLFKQADDKYNSGLFDFEKDKITPTLKVDNKVIKIVIDELYYPKCNYEFSVMPVEILGNAYEQFLGKVIRITPARGVKIEEKPEVRKAGGVFYTPQYIVEYIVKNTVGELIDGKTPKEIEKIKIVDPACGSGSFLLGAFEYLLNYHANWYHKNLSAPQIKKGDVVTPQGTLTAHEKKRILLNNIYGVDLDANAVEVSKLSLLLKCMEGETEASIKQQVTMFHERVLPDLDNNIKDGNSLIDTDIYDSEMDFGAEKRIKPFSWKKGFPSIFKQNGFDIVIGNPPWVDLKGHPAEQTTYFFKSYKTANNRINLYALFIEKSLKLLNTTGKFGFIIPNSLLYQSSYELLRKLILDNWNIEKLIRLPDNVFQGVKAETLIISLGHENKKTEVLLFDRDKKINSVSAETADVTKKVIQKEFYKNEFVAFDVFSDSSKKSITTKIENGTIPLEDLCEFCLGLTPYDKYKGHTEAQIKNRAFHSTTKKDNTFKKLLEGGDIERYFVKWGGNEYISYGSWLGAPRDPKFFKSSRILIRQIISGKPPRIYAAYTEDELYNTQSAFNIISKKGNTIGLKFILALLNSNLLNFYHSDKFLDKSKNLFQKILIQNCKKFPIKKISLDKKQDKIIYDEIVKAVDTIQILSKEIKEEKLQNKIEQLKQRVEHSEEKINQLVYSLYELTTEEIKIVEGGAND